VGSRHGIAPPLGIAMIASVVRQQGFGVEVIDAQAMNWSPDDVAEEVARQQPLLVGISACTPQMTAVNETLAVLRHKAPGVKTIVGGAHAAALPEQTLMETAADFVCTGEGFYPVPELLRCLRDDSGNCETVPGMARNQEGRFVLHPPAPLATDLDRLPDPAWDLLPMDRYRAHNWHGFGQDSRSPYAVIFTSLGCPFNCSYCSVNAVYGRRSYRTRSPERVVAEIDRLVADHGIRHMEIVDDTFTLDPARVHRICDLLIERQYGLNIWAYARTDRVDAALLRKMKRAGFHWVCYGFESGDPDIRRGVRKAQETIPEAVAMTYEAGVHIMANYMFGLPDDNLQSMEQTMAMAREINAEYANFYCLMAYPGSDLYEEAVASGQRLPEVWHGYSQYAYETLPLATRYVSAGEVLKFRDEAFMRYFSDSRYLDRVRQCFGDATVAEIQEMLQTRLKRKYVSL